MLVSLAFWILGLEDGHPHYPASTVVFFASGVGRGKFRQPIAVLLIGGGDVAASTIHEIERFGLVRAVLKDLRKQFGP